MFHVRYVMLVRPYEAKEYISLPSDDISCNSLLCLIVTPKCPIVVEGMRDNGDFIFGSTSFFITT